jgi:hypothetical protein
MSEERKTLRRADAREFIKGQGLNIGDRSLDVMAREGKGPKFSYGPKGSLYSEDELLAFVEAEKARRARRGY